MRVEIESPSTIAVPPSTILPPIDPRVEIHPEERLLFRSLGLTTPEAFLAIREEIISGHPDRHVMRVVLGNGRPAYLKREHRIRWKERFRNWRAGFGWASKSIREGRTLQRIERSGMLGPKWLAFGEDNRGRAFLLVEEIAGAEDLRHSRLTRDMAIRLGRWCAELHDAGVDHPDLYAKHFLIDPSTDAIALLDWQRATIRNEVSWNERIRALATLDATTSANSKIRANFLWAYRRVSRGSRRTLVPTFSQIARQVGKDAKKLERRRGIREQRQAPLPASAQRLVWLDDEALCAIPAVAADLNPATVRAALYDPTRHATSLMLSGNREVRLEVGVYRNPIGRCLTSMRGRAWRSPELRRARLLFHLERHHIAAPRLLAFGQRTRNLKVEAFVLFDAISKEATALSSILRSRDAEWRTRLVDQLADLLCRLHEAGCEAGSLEPFGIVGPGDSPTLIVTHPEQLIFRKHRSARRETIDLERCHRSMMSYCPAEELDRFKHMVAEQRR